MSAGRTSQPTQADEPIPVGSAPTHAPFPKHRGKSDDLALAPPSAPRTSTKPLRKPKDAPQPASFTGPGAGGAPSRNGGSAVWESGSATATPAATTCASPTIDLQVLILSGDGTETDLPAIEQAMDYLGTPYTVWIAKNNPGGLLPSVLANGCTALFQGVVLATDSLGYDNNGSWVSGLSSTEWTNLWTFESTFGIRQITWYTYPSTQYGFTGTPNAVDTTTAPLNASFTTSGVSVFSYVNAQNALPIKLAYTYLAAAANDGTNQVLLQDGAGDALALVHTYSDGRQNLALTFDTNPNLTHDLVLAYGLVNWVTRGIFLGDRQVSFVPQPDDVFIADDTWNFAPGDCNHPVDGTGTSYRITGADLQQAIAWQRSLQSAATTRNVRLGFAFNAFGTTGVYSPDTLTPAVQTYQSLFSWIDHTYDHEDLTTVSYAFAQAEFSQNISAARRLGLVDFSTLNLVTPGITGLTNQQAMQAADDAGVRYVVSDTSMSGYNNPAPNIGIYNPLVPGVLEIPRHPTNLYFNVSQPSEWVNEYNCVYNSYWGQNLSYSQILDQESNMLLSYLLKGDIDPVMFHQSNLRAYDGTHSLLGDLINATIAKYDALFNLPILSPDMNALGQTMANFMQYKNAGVTASYIPGQSITIKAAQAAMVPVTGLAITGSTVYGGQAIAQVSVAAGQSVTLPLKGTVGAAPKITGITPHTGVSGTKVTISGSGLVPGNTTVAFGTQPATSASCASATQCTAVAPEGIGAVDVSVTAAGQQSPISSTTDQFTYTYATPKVTSLSVTSGPIGLPVTVNGSGFVPGATTVRFGSAPAVVLNCTTTACSVTAPSGTSAVDVTVTTPGGTSATSSADRFTYTAGTVFAVYGDALAPGWEDWSGGVTVNWANTSPVYAGKDSIALTVTQADGDLDAQAQGNVNLKSYAALRFAVQATQPGANFQVQLTDANGNTIGNAVLLNAYGGAPVAGFWTLYSIPLSDFGVANKSIGGVMIADNLGAPQPTIYIDEIDFVGR